MVLHIVNVASKPGQNPGNGAPCQGYSEACAARRACVARAGVVPLPGMNFGKFAFGALILAIGVVLLAVRVGFAHPDTPIILLRYWPILLIAFGLAFLAGAIKNPMVGCFAILLILGGTAFGMYWMYHMEKQGKLTRAIQSLDLGKSNLSSLLLRVTTF